MSDKYIGIFDSGIGGLTVLKSIVRSLPEENIIYFGDTAHLPYGTKSKRQIEEFVLKDVEFLSSFDLKAVVIACNTADSTAGHLIREKYDLPVYGVVEPASKKAALVTENNKIGVIATTATVNSKAYIKAISAHNPKAEIFTAACPLLVPMVENGRFRKGDGVIETVLREYLEPLKEKGIDTLVLGCTHYPLLSDLIEHICPGIKIISSSDEAASILKDNLSDINTSANKGIRKYYVSDNPEGFKTQASFFLEGELKEEVILINP